MIEVKTLLVMPKSYIENELNDYYDYNFIKYPEICYTSLDEESKIETLVKSKDFETKYLDVCIMIKYNNTIIMGYDIHSLNLWYDLIEVIKTIINKEENYFDLGIEPIGLKIGFIDETMMKWDIIDVVKPEKVYYSSIVSKIELLKGLINGGLEFHQNLLSLDIPNKEIIEETLEELTELQTTFIKINKLI